MPRKKVCPKCSFINDRDEYFCAHCNEDISFSDVIQLSDECRIHPFYYEGEFRDECPIDICEEEKIEETKEETIPQEEKPAPKKIKICPDCETKVSVSTVICPVCTRALSMIEAVDDVEPITSKEEEKIDTIPQPPLEVSDQEIQGYFNPDGFAFRFQNVNLDIDFRGGEKCYIGRNYQMCFEQRNIKGVSRHHCYLIMGIDGSVFVGEDIERPSMYGTAVIKAKNKEMVCVRPGEDGQVEVKQGDQIVLAYKARPHGAIIEVIQR